MMKPFRTLRAALALAAAVILALTGAPAARAEGGWDQVWTQVCPTVVQVRAVAEDWTYEGGITSEVTARASGLYVAPGCVVTNAHAVEDSDYVQIEDAAGRVYEAAEVLTDATIDLAVLRLDAPLEGVEPLSPAGDAAMCAEVLIVGHATAGEDTLAHTATRGVVSGLGRDGDTMGVFSRAVGLIQTDALVYGGFAGAGLFGADGAWLGMVVLPRLDDETAAGVYFGPGFALPAAQVASAAADLLEYGMVRRPRMGVQVSEVDGPETALRSWPPCGMAVVDVEPGGPADRAGMMLYDIITEVNGIRIHNYNELSAILDACAAGDVVHIVVYRCYDENGEMIADPAYVELDMTLEIR